jgi:hypothetical protein
MPRMTPAIRRHGPLALALVACLLLAVSQFLDLYSIRINTVVKDLGTVGGHHAYSVLLIAVAAAVMSVGALVGGSRPAAVALLVLAVAALSIALLRDLPVVDDEGLYGQRYEGAKAQAEIGIWLELIGAFLLLVTAVGIVAFVRRAPEPGRPARRERVEPSGEPT